MLKWFKKDKELTLTDVNIGYHRHLLWISLGTPDPKVRSGFICSVLANHSCRHERTLKDGWQ